MFNRHGQRMTIEKEFSAALALLSEAALWWTPQPVCDLEWLDCEGLDRRHPVGRGTLIVLDAPLCPQIYRRRRWFLSDHLPHTSYLDIPERCEPNSVFLSYSLPADASTPQPGLSLWHELLVARDRLDCEFYEGVVAKRADSKYPVQLTSPEREFPYWVKHRWAF